MVLAHKQSVAKLKHILNEVINEGDHSILELTIKNAGFNSVLEILTLERIDLKHFNTKIQMVKKMRLHLMLLQNY